MAEKSLYARAEAAMFQAVEDEKADTLHAYKCWLESQIYDIAPKLASSPSSTWETSEFKEMASREKDLRTAYGCLLEFKHRRFS